VVQERTLSPRTLSYGAKSIYLECLDCNSSEPWPHGGDTWNWNQEERYRRPNEAFHSLNIPNALRRRSMPFFSHIQSFLYAWYKLRDKYAACSPTHRNDMLVAINGMTQAIGLRNSLSSIAGFWEQYSIYSGMGSGDRPSTC